MQDQRKALQWLSQRRDRNVFRKRRLRLSKEMLAFSLLFYSGPEVPS